MEGQTYQIDYAYVLSVKNDPPAGYIKLARSILILALQDATKGDKDALMWLNSDDTWYAYNFLNVCKMLSLSPWKIRAAINSQWLRPWLEEYKKAQGYGVYFSHMAGV